MIALSFDLDWAPAWATLRVARTLAEAGLTGTFFVTHACESLPELRAAGFELGWHPSYLPGSSHGSGVNEVLDTCAALVPEAVGVRAHGLVRGTPYLLAYRARGLRYEASDLLDGEHGLGIHRSFTGLACVPTFFEDDVHLERGLPMSLAALGLDRPGLKVFDFHPVLLALNCADLGRYRDAKAALARAGRPLSEATEADLAPHTQHGLPGDWDLFLALVAALRAHPERRAGTLAELVEAHSGLRRHSE